MIRDCEDSMTRGTLIGAGKTRDVYVGPSGLVIKVSRPGLSKVNWYEWALWNTCPEIREWLAPVRGISPTFRTLLMDRGERALIVPSPLPDWIIDANLDNWISLRGKIVLCDYGHLPMARKIFEP